MVWTRAAWRIPSAVLTLQSSGLTAGTDAAVLEVCTRMAAVTCDLNLRAPPC